MRAWELQEAIHTRLEATSALMAVATDIYDHVPEDATFPYVVIGEDVATPVDIDDVLDADHVVTMHTWSRYRGQKETKQIQQGRLTFFSRIK